MERQAVREILESIEGEYRRYKTLGEDAIAQLTDLQLVQPAGDGGNSIATIVWHLSGNLVSRFSDFLGSDGEKPWRDRDSEFQPRVASRQELREKWEVGWSVLFTALSELDDARLQATVTIRGVPHSVIQALHRSLAHASYHVGQIVFHAKALRAHEWRHLSIPPGGTAAYNRNPTAEKPPGASGKLGPSRPKR